jgi:hypothetical protein
MQAINEIDAGEHLVGFRSLLEQDAEVMARIGPKLDAVFDPWAGLEHTEIAYDRLGLGAKTR